MKNLEDIYTELGLSPTNYARWSKTILKDCREGQHYTVETNNFGKKLYKLSDLTALIVLNNHLDKAPSITKEAILEFAKTSEVLGIKILGELTTKYYDYFISQVTKTFNASIAPTPPPSAVCYK